LFWEAKNVKQKQKHKNRFTEEKELKVTAPLTIQFFSSYFSIFLFPKLRLPATVMVIVIASGNEKKMYSALDIQNIFSFIFQLKFLLI
jgi:hypothetical protein